MASPATGWPFMTRGPVETRHGFIGSWPIITICRRCGRGPRARIHRIGSRCSVCFRYYKHYELDSSRRCDTCRP